jgi:hypothetical protein
MGRRQHSPGTPAGPEHRRPNRGLSSALRGSLETRPRFLGFLLAALLVTTASHAAGPTEFYVDPDFAGPLQDGSAADPWTRLDAAPQGTVWTTINRALANSDVIVYFSARGADADANQISTYGVSLARTDQSDHRLALDGMSRYNAADGRPRWFPYDGLSRLEIHAGYPVSAYLPGTNQDYVTIRGFRAIGGFGGRGGQALAYWGGSHVLIENCEFTHAPEARDGACVQFGYAWSEHGTRQNGGCSDITIRHNVIHDTLGEGIYIGGSGNTIDPATGKVRPAHSGLLIEGNHIFNTGARGAEGDCIDLKDGLSDVTIRDNICHNTQGGNAIGISSLSPFTAERNVVYAAAGHGISVGTYWGSGFGGVTLRHNLVFGNGKSGIYLSSDAGKPVTDAIVENNTIHGNRGAGLSIGVNRDGSITGLQVRDNIISRNAPGIGGYGRASYRIMGNDLFANQPDYAWPFRTTDDPGLASQNSSVDPLFANPSDPPGPDGEFFTADDGFAPAAAAARIGYLAPSDEPE